MVGNFLAGGAAINVFARQNGLALTVVDAGVAHDFAPSGTAPSPPSSMPRWPGDGELPRGTGHECQQCAAALEHGAGIVGRLAAADCNVVGFGEMGIGNTASASLITHCLTGVPLADCVGRGTGS